ncbi:hypothetical protein ACIP60_38195, partial [Kitasatospora sp. NPDC088783]
MKPPGPSDDGSGLRERDERGGRGEPGGRSDRGGWPGRMEQRVVAEAGFAYGAIGADIHVFGDGTPVYVLENWRPGEAVEDAWLGELPSRMLNARWEVVGFTGRAAELAALRAWCGSGPRLAVRWLHGPGGQGKTRLAARLARELAAEGWKVVTATEGPGSVVPPPGSQDLRPDGAPGLLLLVDYADRWPLSHLTWLLSNALLHDPAVPARVLMIARDTGPWPAVRAILADHRAGTSAQELAALGDGDDPEGHRARMFTAARDGFAARYGAPVPGWMSPPPWLDGPEFGLTLAVHMAALVSVDAHLAGRRTPTDPAGLTVYLLDREHLHWARRHGDGSHRLDGDGTDRLGGDGSHRLDGDGTDRLGGDGSHRLDGDGTDRLGGDGSHRLDGDGTDRLGGDGSHRLDGDGTDRLGGDGSHRLDGDGTDRLGGDGSHRLDGDGTDRLGGDGSHRLDGDGTDRL